MKDDIRNLREITDLVLKDVYVTDELKNKTLELCKKEKNSILKPFLAVASSAAIIAVSFTSYQYFSHRTDKNLGNKQIVHNINNTNSSSSVKKIDKPINNNTEKSVAKTTSKEIAYENTKEKDLKNTNNVQQSDSSSIPSTVEDKKTPIDSSKPSSPSDNSTPTPTNDTTTLNKSSENPTTISSRSSVGNTNDSILQDSSMNENSNNIAASPPPQSLSACSATLSTSEAEKYWGGKLLLPSHIPTNFELTDISVPNDNKELYVKLTYSSKNDYFKLTENKSTKYNISGKSIDINGVSATITEDNDAANSNAAITQIVWVKDNVQYSLVGNISDAELVNIAKSLN